MAPDRPARRPVTAASCPLCGTIPPDLYAEVEARLYWGCAVCGLVFLDPAGRPGPGEERAHYRSHENDPADPRYRAFLGRLTDPLLPHLRPGTTALDYGAGPGSAIRPMLAAHGVVVAEWDPFFAPDPAVLERRYDLVLCSEAAEHFFAPGDEFARIDRLLRPGGRLGLMTEPLTDALDFRTWWYRRDPTHVCFYRPRTFAWLARRFAWEMEVAGRTVVLYRKTGQDGPT